MPPLLYIVLAVAGTAVCWWASGQLDMAARRLSASYGLPPLVHGAILAAIGSSFPELASAVLATALHGDFELGVAAIVGSAVFNILVIPGVAGLAGGPLSTDRTLVYKDAQFYVTSVATLLLVFALAVIYNPDPAGSLVGEIDRPLALIPIGLYGLYVFLQWQDTREYDAPEAPEDVRLAVEWARLMVSLVLIVAGVEALVRAAIGLGDWLGTPSFLWGLTVVAAGTSLPDMFISVRAARAGDSVVSLGNVLGSNIFDLLIAVPAGVLVAGTTPVDFAVAVPLMAFLVLATIVLFTALRTRLVLSRREAVALLVLYAAFLAWMVLETLDVTSVLT